MNQVTESEQSEDEEETDAEQAGDVDDEEMMSEQPSDVDFDINSVIPRLCLSNFEHHKKFSSKETWC